MDILSLIQTSQPVVVEIGDRKTVCGLAGGVPVQVETSLRGRGGRIVRDCLQDSNELITDNSP